MKLLKQNSFNKVGFTLAEVLITLGIIGIVAALTVPTLIAKQQKKEYVTKLKKAYSQINQALVQMSNDAGCPGDLKCTGLFDNSTNNMTLGDEFIKHYNVYKNCKTSSNQNCFTSNTNWHFDGSGNNNTNFDSEGKYKFISTDNISISIINYRNNCDTPTYSTNRTQNMTQTCGHVIIDTNSFKKPNNMGRDTFLFFITNGKGPLLYPMGGADNNFDGAFTTADQWWNGTHKKCYPGSKDGYRCAGRIMEENWEMNY